MTPVEQARVSKRTDKLKAQIAKLKDQLQVARAKGKGTTARAAGGRASSKGRTRARTRSARSGGAEATA